MKCAHSNRQSNRRCLLRRTSCSKNFKGWNNVCLLAGGLPHNKKASRKASWNRFAEGPFDRRSTRSEVHKRHHYMPSTLLTHFTVRCRVPKSALRIGHDLFLQKVSGQNNHVCSPFCEQLENSTTTTVCTALFYEESIKELCHVLRIFAAPKS